MTNSERLSFQADIRELMNLIIHAFYSNRDVFLREVISNASDANDKQRLQDLQNGKLDQTYEIRLQIDKDERKLVIEDDGIGMNREDLVNHLSTIARSGTKEFVRSIQEKSDQIGQFGVGFYSVYLVADRVQVITQKLNETVLKWESDADEYYTIDEHDSVLTNGHGTRLCLFLKDDASDYLEESHIRRIITTHSSFITYPIRLWTTKEVDAPVSEEEEIVEDDDGTVVVDEQEEEKKTESKTEKQQIQEWETINGDRPIWYVSPSDVTDDDYKALYKTLSNDYEEPLIWRHFQTEGAFEFRGILFIPKRAPYDIMSDRSREKRKIRLYVKKVLVLNELDREMMPDWMNFVVGVIDSSDLPLNVSREMLQQTKVLRAMKSQLKKQVMTMLNEVVNEGDKYKTFYDGFQRNIKVGIHDGGGDELLTFLRVHVNSFASDKISLDQYIERLDDGQKIIYYIAGTDCEQNPMVKLYLSKGYSVLFFNESIDEFMLQRLTKYKDYDLVNIVKDHETPWGSSTTANPDDEKLKAFCDFLKKTINDSSLDSVRVSTSLTEADQDPAFLFTSKFGWTGNMEKIMTSQPLNDSKSMFWMKGKKILEVNLRHPIIQSFFDSQDPSQTTRIHLFYQSCLLSAGFPLQDQTEFVQSVWKTLATTDALTDTTTTIEDVSTITDQTCAQEVGQEVC